MGGEIDRRDLRNSSYGAIAGERVGGYIYSRTEDEYAIATQREEMEVFCYFPEYPSLAYSTHVRQNIHGSKHLFSVRDPYNKHTVHSNLPRASSD